MNWKDIKNMRILIIGGTGHVGTFLTRKLLSQGHEVYIGTRGKHGLREGGCFEGARFITCDAGDKDSLEALKAYQFDTVVDFPGTAYHIWQVLGNTISHLVACGSLWMFGYPHKIPTPEMTQEECPFEGYKLRYEQILVKAYGDIYGVEIPVKRVSWKEYAEEINPRITAWWHFYAHMQPDISKAKELLGYKLQYTPEEAMKRAVGWMREEGLL